jgi:cysteine desulfurase
MLYLDHAATSPLRPVAWEAMAALAGHGLGNPSGSHRPARRAKDLLEEARERVAAVLGCRPLEIVFTSGGTESNALALQGRALVGGSRGGVVTTAVEHPAVLEAARFLARLGCPLTVVGVDGTGRVDPEAVAAAVGPGTAVVSVMAANNETGAIQAVRRVAEAVRAAAPGVAVHSDAVQALVSQPLQVAELGVDLLTVSPHKVGGPTGVGVLFVREGTHLEPVLHGGGQELGRRSGTHHVMGAVGAAAALEAAAAGRERLCEVVAAERASFEAGLAGIARRTIPVEASLPQHSHLRFPGIRNETLLVRLDRVGLAASAASACSSGAATVSHVLTAMSLSREEARECLRFSFGWTTEPGDGARAAAAVREALEGLR